MSSIQQKKSTPFNSTFYVANTMEIFERLAWYGFFTLSSLYMTSPTSQGGLGFSDQERGFLQGMVPFFLYLFPVITGAIADRYGYKKMFIISFIIMTPAYYLLGQVTSFWAFCSVFFAVAIGAACFKPIVVGTISRVTDSSNRGLGFGIFYTMVNIGGFLGPLIAGYVRVIGWDMVFIMSSLWIAINFVPAIFFYKEPKVNNDNKSLKQVLNEAQQVLGNGRLALLIVPLIILLMIAAKGTITWLTFTYITIVWLTINYCWDRLIATTYPQWYLQKLKIGNKSFIIYLLILTGFWTMYLQLFITTPLFIRDYVNTQDLVQLISWLMPSALTFLAGVNIEQLTIFIEQQSLLNLNDVKTLNALYFELVNYKVMIPKEVIVNGLQSLQSQELSAVELAKQWAQNYRQVNPEYIVNLDFGCIILCQLFISKFFNRYNALPVIVFGTIVIAASFVLTGLAHGLLFSGAIITTSIIMFSFGEMIASPKSQEYVAAIAPKENSAMYMGYYFVSMALGFLFAGVLSGWSYPYFTQELNSPLGLWGLYASIGLITAILLIVFHKRWLPQWQPTKIDV
ncbi:MFS transporter [Thalassotalea profundi]|uniref:Major facilitator superfamily (MFS) profile domain-containing protein n=1 Tax=Thalassotalea profundi TaxID=2036687 RepID=A0ABQ3IGI1_9GAMM|nr:MFS transporter [Thalassotalea profundi]GHE77942.1 hypothetical protein GCM10011501_02010 [Thalassotalea profundi]